MGQLITAIIPFVPNGSPEVISSINDKRVKVLIERGTNPSKNRNNGMRKSKTPFVAFFNGHSKIGTNWVDSALDFMKKNPSIDVVGGPQHNAPDEMPFGRASGYAMSSPFGAGGVWKRYAGKKVIYNADETMLTSSNLICRKKVFSKVKFDENLYPGEDPKFISDAKKEGFQVAFSPDLIVFNRRRDNILSLAKQVFNYGLSRQMKESLTSTLKKPFFFIPSLFVIYLVLWSVLALIIPFYSFPLIAYLVLLFVFSLALPLSKKDPQSISHMFVVFPTIHISYGLGFIVGLLQKLFKHKKI